MIIVTPQALIGVAVLGTAWIAFMLGHLALAALWDYMILVGVCYAVFAVFRTWGQLVDSWKPLLLWLPLTALPVILVTGYNWDALTNMTGIRTAVPIYNVTGMTFGSFTDDFEKIVEEKLQTATGCSRVLSGKIKVPDGGQTCRSYFPAGIDDAKVADIRNALDDGSISEVQAALERHQRHPFFAIAGIAPATWNSFGDWYRGDAKSMCASVDPAKASDRTALVYCSGSDAQFMERFCDVNASRSKTHELFRTMCSPGSSTYLTGSDLEDLARSESLRCDNAYCWSREGDDDRSRKESDDLFKWLKKRAGWKT
jgi:hypothetical protein